MSLPWTSAHSGAKLSGVAARIKPGEVIGITYGKNKGRFAVVWAGSPGTPQAGQIGVVNTSPEKYIWDLALPNAGIRSLQSNLGERPPA